ncbi:D-glycero-alpha-D-manno-heptose-1,7-bisphosphate 7-phosphatase [Hyalangium gracile]|uniref:D-glycero-alpha-D-manno-heptose-1,7-bisphosphate 7-phosphatase n=1 Tax=Hyalangium gracile TaxID=394092 RepID=UPI001CCF5765|nr:HAD family hydrolase [Hyalangium gracile]
MSVGTPAVFLDRDGVLVDELGYLTRVADLRLFPGAGAAVRRIHALGYPVVVVTNQSAVARGMVSPAGLEEIHAELRAQLGREDARLAGLYMCPHHPEAPLPEWRQDCDCRKPRPGMLVRAARELGLALDERSVLVGDQHTDLECARRAGISALLVRTGKGQDTARTLSERGGVIGICDSVADVPDVLRAWAGRHSGVMT